MSRKCFLSSIATWKRKTKSAESEPTKASRWITVKQNIIEANLNARFKHEREIRTRNVNDYFPCGRLWLQLAEIDFGDMQI